MQSPHRRLCPLRWKPSPPQHLWPQKLQTHRTLLPSQHHGHCTRWIVDAALEAAGRGAQRTATEINSVYVLKSAVEAGIGPTIMPLGLAQREVEDGRLVAHRIDSPALARVLGLCLARHQPRTNAKRAICRLVVEVVRELCESGTWSGARFVGDVRDAGGPAG